MINFRMVKISTEQFAILANTAPADNATINLENQLEFKEARSERKIACGVVFKFESNGSPFLILNVVCTFEVSEGSWSKMGNADDSITLPKDFLCHIAVHTVGTARGILHVKTEGTPFNQYILPPINVEEIVNKDVVL